MNRNSTMKLFLTALLLAPWAVLPAAEPTAGDKLPIPDGTQYVRVERSDSDNYKFLHDPAIEVHKGELFAAWYNCPRAEIVGESRIRGRRSKDGGKTWGPLEVIASDTRGDGTYYVPAVMLSHGGTLYAFVGTMKGGHDLIKSCAVYALDETANRWQPRGEIADLFLPNCRPVKMADGNWIMAGRAATRFGVKPFLPAVAISNGDDLTGRWNVVPIQKEKPQGGDCPETTVWVEGRNVIALTRNSAGKPFVYASHDYGRTWNIPPAFERSKGKRIPAATSKLYAGHLSTGERYVVYSKGTGEREPRGSLLIQVSRPGDIAECCTPEKVWRVQDRNDPALTAPPGPKAFSYPCVVEHEGSLFVIYTVGHHSPRQCEIAIIPIASLQLR